MKRKKTKQLKKLLKGLTQEIENMTAQQLMILERINETSRIINIIREDSLDTVAEIKAKIDTE